MRNGRRLFRLILFGFVIIVFLGYLICVLLLYSEYIYILLGITALRGCVLCGPFTYSTPEEFIATGPDRRGYTDIHSAEPPLFSPNGFTPHRVATAWAHYHNYIMYHYHRLNPGDFPESQSGGNDMAKAVYNRHVINIRLRTRCQVCLQQ